MADNTLGLSNYGIKNTLVAGTVVTALGFVWLIGGILVIQRIFLYSFILIIAGFITLGKGYYQAKKERAKRIKSQLLEQVLDSE